MDDQSAMPRPVRRVRRGFTLIEMLVVIGLIAVLISILLVALRGARENVRATQCMSNLRQIGLATQAYTVDYKNRLPYEDRGDEAMGFICWIDVLHGDLDGDGQVDTTGYLEVVDADETSLVCPSVLSGENFRFESYRINSKLSETNPTRPGYDPQRRLDTIPNQSQTVAFFDADVGGDRASFKGRWREKDNDVAFRHNTSTILTFLDWHVERVTKDELDDRSRDNTDIIWQIPQLGAWNPG